MAALSPRHRRLPVVAGIVWLIGLAGSSFATAQVPVAAQVVNVDRYPSRRIEFPNGVIGLPDLTYSRPSGFRPLKLDLYRPGAVALGGTLPFVVYIHRGGWAGGTPRTTSAFENWPGVLASLAARGYVVASITYRFSGEAVFPAAEQDVKSAIRWLRTNAAEYGIDPGRGLVWGASAGSHLAALAATSCGVAALEPPAPRQQGRAGTAEPARPEASDRVQGLVSWFGVFDFQPIVSSARDTSAGSSPPDSGPGRLLGCQPSACPPAVVRLASPMSFVDSHTPPALLIHGTSDKTVAPQQSQDMYALLKSKDVPVEVMMIPASGTVSSAKRTKQRSPQVMPRWREPSSSLTRQSDKNPGAAPPVSLDFAFRG